MSTAKASLLAVRPSRYELALKLDPDADQYSGTVVVTFTFVDEKRILPAPLSTLQCNIGSALKVEHIEIQRVEPDGTRIRLSIASVCVDVEQCVMEIDLKQAVELDCSYELRILFSAPLVPHAPVGFCQDSWPEEVQSCCENSPNLLIAYPRDHASGAHTYDLFPCFDDPRFKTVVDLTVIAPTGLYAIGNMPSTSRESELETTHTFQSTPPISIAQVTIVVGEFASPLCGNASHLVRTFHRPGSLHTETLIAAADEFLEFCGQWFDLPYMLPKLDLLDLPHTRVSSTVSWGFCFLGSDNGLESLRQQVVHQWVTSLATPLCSDGHWFSGQLAEMISRLIAQSDDAEQKSTFFQRVQLWMGATAFRTAFSRFIQTFAYRTVRPKDFDRFFPCGNFSQRCLVHSRSLEDPVVLSVTDDRDTLCLTLLSPNDDEPLPFILVPVSASSFKLLESRSTEIPLHATKGISKAWLAALGCLQQLQGFHVSYPSTSLRRQVLTAESRFCAQQVHDLFVLSRLGVRGYRSLASLLQQLRLVSPLKTDEAWDTLRAGLTSIRRGLDSPSTRQAFDKAIAETVLDPILLELGWDESNAKDNAEEQLVQRRALDCAIDQLYPQAVTCALEDARGCVAGVSEARLSLIIRCLASLPGSNAPSSPLNTLLVGDRDRRRLCKPFRATVARYSPDKEVLSEYITKLLFQLCSSSELELTTLLACNPQAPSVLLRCVTNLRKTDWTRFVGLYLSDAGRFCSFWIHFQHLAREKDQALYNTWLDTHCQFLPSSPNAIQVLDQVRKSIALNIAWTNRLFGL